MSDRKDGHATLSVDRAHGQAGEVVVPGDEIAAGASVVLVGASVLAANGSPVLGLVIGGVVGAFMTVLLAGLLTLLSWVLEKGSRRRPSQGLPPGASGRTSQRLASVDPAGSLSELSLRFNLWAFALREPEAYAECLCCAHLTCGDT